MNRLRLLSGLLACAAFDASSFAQNAAVPEIAAPAAPPSFRWSNYTLTDVRRVAVAPDTTDELRLPVDTGQRGDAWARLDGVVFSEGEISFEFRNIPPNNRGHVGVALRVSADGKRFDTLYFSPALSPSRIALKPEDAKGGKAVKHVPVTTGEVRWWEYVKPEYMADVEIGDERWIKARVRVRGDRAEVFVDDAPAPAATFTLEGDPSATAIAIWTHASSRTLRFRNLAVTPLAK